MTGRPKMDERPCFLSNNRRNGGGEIFGHAEPIDKCTRMLGRASGPGDRAERDTSMRRLIVALCIASALISPAMAANTAAELAEMCEDGASQNVGFCAGYAEGLAETLQATGQTCPPKEATLEQALKVIKKYVADHPESHHLPAVLMAVQAVKEAFPCKAGPATSVPWTKDQSRVQQ